jgi:uncharacterized Rmd1/YagE family protein
MSGVHERNLERFTEQMSQVDALALVVLKGHLLLEEQLERILGTFVFHPEHLEAARLSFAQKVSLARSISLDEHENSMWELILAVNAMRNELAHALHSEKREKRFERLKALYMAENDVSAEEANALETHIVASFAVALAIGFLGSFEEEIVRFKDYVKSLDQVVNPHRHEKPRDE